MENRWNCYSAINMKQVKFIILNLVCIWHCCLCLWCDSLEIPRKSEKLERGAI